MSREWERLFDVALDEIDSIRDPRDRLIAAEQFRDFCRPLLDNLVDYQTYRFRLDTGMTYEDMGAAVLESPKVMRDRVTRWCFRRNVPRPNIWRDRDFKPEAFMDLRHLNTHAWRRNRWSQG